MIEALFDEAATVRDIMPLYTMTRDVIGASDFVPGARLIETIDKLLREGQRSGTFRDGCPAIQAPIAHAMVEGGMRAWMLNPTPERAKQVRAELETLFGRAFLNPNQDRLERSAER